MRRQRFSLAHEFKHILDHRFVDVLYSGVRPEDRARWIEQTCDFFAACLLMPRAWVKRAYTTGTQRLPQLADRFAVSQAAMHVRLTQIGLIDRPERCSRMHPGWALREIRAAGTPSSYERTNGGVDERTRYLEQFEVRKVAGQPAVAGNGAQ